MQPTTLPRAGWLDVLDDLHGGMGHDLNGRVSSLDALAQLYTLDPGSVDAPLIESEAERLAELARRFAFLGGKLDAPAEAWLATDVAERAASLARRHRGLDSLELRVEAEADVPPLRASLSRLLRVLLIVLSRAGRGALDLGGGWLTLGVVTRDGGAGFVVRHRGGSGRWDPNALADVAEPLGAVLALDGGLLVLGSEAAEVDLPPLRLPGR
jgi:hypothetical protein